MPGAGRPWTDDEDQRLRQLHAEGMALHSIAKEIGRAKSSVHDRAQHLDLTWDRTASPHRSRRGPAWALLRRPR